MELPAHVEPAVLWRQICAELRRSVGDSTFEIWLDQLHLETVQDSNVILTAPSETRAWVQKRFGRVLERSIRTVLSDEARVVFTGEARTPSCSHQLSAEQATEDALNPRYRFDQFIIGNGNCLAHAAALAVAELPGQAYNPLFLYAPSGLGKTHLLHAIGNYMRDFGGGAVVRCTTVEAFTNHFVTALSSRTLDRFKHAYRDADVLLMDDVQFLASKAKTEEEFFHTFNALYENGRQLVLTCDRLPSQLRGVEERLRERFESGLVAHIEPPDFETRVAILRKRAALDGVGVPDPAVLELIARRVTDNVRQLEGALIRVVAQHSLTHQPIAVELASAVIAAMGYADTGSGPSIDGVQAVVADHFQISVADLVSASRASRIAWPRQVAIHIARELTGASLASIGTAFGGRNHATIVHACKRVLERIGHDPQAAEDVDGLVQQLRAERGDRNC